MIGGNFLSIIQLMSDYDSILRELLDQISGFKDYLSPTIKKRINTTHFK